MSLPTLPSLDYTNEETLQTSADARAATAIHLADGPVYFKGLELRLTPSIKSLFKMLSFLDGAAESGGDRDDRDACLLLYLSSQPDSAWSDPIVQGRIILTPLRSRPTDWLREIDRWVDGFISCSETDEVAEAVGRLWSIHHAPRVTVEDDPQKKTSD